MTAALEPGETPVEPGAALEESGGAPVESGSSDLVLLPGLYFQYPFHSILIDLIP